MTSKNKGPNFAGSVRAVSLGKPDAIVICCSAFDAAHYVESFVANKLNTRCFDLVALPGGAFGLSTSNSDESARRFLTESVKFLCSNHMPSHILLFGHIPCAHYLAMCHGNDNPDDLRALILGDMQSAAQAIRGVCNASVVIEGYVAELRGNSIEFERADILPSLQPPCGRAHEYFGC